MNTVRVELVQATPTEVFLWITLRTPTWVPDNHRSNTSFKKHPPAIVTVGLCLASLAALLLTQ